jgi:hypothetical protein
VLDGFVADVPRSSPALPVLSGTGGGSGGRAACSLRSYLKGLRARAATGDPYTARRFVELWAGGLAPGAQHSVPRTIPTT